MVRKLLVCFLFILVVMPFVLAMDTSINIRTLPDHKVSVFVMNEGNPTILNSYHVNSGAGEVLVTHTGSEDVIDIRVKVTKDGANVLNELFEGHDAGFPAYFQLIPGDISEDYKADDEAKAKANESAVQEEETQNVSTNKTLEVAEEPINNTGVTGLAVSDNAGIEIPKITYFIIGGIVLALVIVLVIFKMGGFSTLSKQGDNAYNYKPIKPADLDREIIAAERKIKEAKAELSKYQNKGKIEALKRHIEEKQEELHKLEGAE